MITLQAGIDTVVLPGPLFGDRDTVDYGAATNRNRSDEPLIRPGLEVTTRFFEFEALTSAEATDAVLFFDGHAGELVTLTDYNGEVSTGVVLDPDIVKIVVKEPCSYDLSFRFLEQ